MIDAQFYLAIGVPMLFNSALITIVFLSLNSRMSALETRMLALEQRFEILTGTVADVDTRLSVLEDRLKRP